MKPRRDALRDHYAHRLFFGLAVLPLLVFVLSWWGILSGASGRSGHRMLDLLWPSGIAFAALWFLGVFTWWTDE